MWIYSERERERGRDIHIYIYIYICNHLSLDSTILGGGLLFREGGGSIYKGVYIYIHLCIKP